MKSIQIVSIPVTDQQKAKEFYLNIGFSVIVEAPFEGDKQWIQMGLTGSDATITLVTWFPAMPAGCVQGLVIKTDDIEKDFKELNEKGIKTGAIEKLPWGRFMSVTDPDGNMISLHQ